jgi:ribosomal-protein-alanine N-acetyltransferase
MTEIPCLQTPRLTLRPFALEDAPVLYRINQREGVLRYFPGTTPPSLEKVARFVAYQQKHWEKYGYGNWAIVPNGETEMTGWVGLQFLLELNETEVGFLLDTPFWGKGYATEAARASLQFGFDHFDFPYIIALVHPDNLASRLVIAKCGMTYVETINLWDTDLMRHTVERSIFHREVCNPAL